MPKNTSSCKEMLLAFDAFELWYCLQMTGTASGGKESAVAARTTLDQGIFTLSQPVVLLSHRRALAPGVSANCLMMTQDVEL